MTPILIERFDDPRIEVYRDVRDKDLRGHGRLFMAESELVLRRLLSRPERLHSILISPSRLAALEADGVTLPESVPVYVADVELMTRVAGFHIHRGVLAAGVRPDPHDLAIDRALAGLRERPRLTLLVAEGLTNVDNMGAIFRNGAAFGVDGIVLDPTSCDPLYRKAIRVSMGHVLSTPWAVSSDWPNDLDRLRDEWGCTVVGAETGVAAREAAHMAQAERLAIVLGSEAHGLSDGAVARCDEIVCIPMAEGVPSLNVAVASAVLLYERRRGA